MPTSRPFAYNTGSTISGTIQVGNLAVGTPTSGFTGTPKWWNGPDEELGYVIAIPVSANTQPTPVSGVTASVGFNRSTALTNSSFIEIANLITGQSFSTAGEASTFLTSNGYWNSYECPNISLNNLLAYYALDNNGNDSSGNGYNLTTVGSVTYVTGYNTPYAALCDNSNYLFQSTYNFPSTAMTQDISAVMWVKTNGITTSSFSVGTRALLNYYVSPVGWRIYISKDSGNQFTYGCSAGNQGVGINIPTVLGWPYNNTWIQLAMTYSSATGLKLYFNGEFKNSIAGTRTIAQQSAPLSIRPGSSGWNAAYDEVSVWNRVLSDAEIATLYNTTCPLL